MRSSTNAIYEILYLAENEGRINLVRDEITVKK